MKLLDNSTSKVMKDDSDRSMPPIVPSLVWKWLWGSMCMWAIVGPLVVVLWVASQFVDLPDWLSLFAASRETLFTLIFLGGIGVSFVWLRLRGYIKFSGE